MTMVAKTLTEYAFNELNLNKVEIRVALDNKKSQGICRMDLANAEFY